MPEPADDLSDGVVARNIVGHIFAPGTEHIVSQNRVGRRRGEKPRPLLIKFSNPVTARTILRNKKLISTSAVFSGVTISDDATPYQISCLQRAREDLKARQSRGETNITIKYVRGIPTVVDMGDSSKQKN